MDISSALPQLSLLIVSAYIIYFSLEDSGERLGTQSEEYLTAKERYDRLRERLSGEDIDALRRYLAEYSKEELSFRKRGALMAAGFSEGDLERLRRGEIKQRAERRALKKIDRLRPIVITPRALLSRDKAQRRSELEDPSRKKLPRLLLKLIPSTLCMTLTVSLMLTAKDGLTASVILEGLLKLSSLPMIAFRGYSAGYSYTKNSVSLWLETKSSIIEGFLGAKGNQ